MAHGAEDYSNVRKKEYSYRIDDLAELAARVGSPVVYDRRGEVVFMETFAYGFDTWQKAYSGAYSRVVLDPIRFVSNGFSALLGAGTDEGGYAILYLNVPYLSVDSLGLEFRGIINANVNYIRGEIWRYDGSYQHQANLYYYPVSGDLKVKVKSGGIQTILSGETIALDVEVFSFFKLVISVQSETFLRVLFNGKEINISDLSYHKVESKLEPHIKIRFTCQSNGAGNAELFLDNVILTRNEI